jgi:hypothetical protein
MKTTLLRCTIVIAVLSLLVSCGGGGGDGGSNPSACTPNGNIWLLDSGGSALHATSVTAAQNASVPNVPVSVGYTSLVAAIAAGYPPEAVDPRTFGMNIVTVGVPASNPTGFELTFDAHRAPATYTATWRFVAVDAGSHPLGCQDLPVTFTIN